MHSADQAHAAFFAGDERFYIRGLDYQPGGSSKLVDPIADIDLCKRDVAKFKELGLNTIRVYSVDNTANHDECMAELADAGIYLALDVNTPDYSINRKDPKPSYNEVYLQSIFATVDAFAKYTNTLLFFSGNEVINDGPSSKSAPYVKATTRDLREYIKERGLRKIPVGYSAADVDSNRFQMAQYMNCGSDEERSDFFAFNDYSWCDPSSFKESGWDQKVKNFTNYGLPLFLSEYGCIKPDRQFKEVASLFSSDMSAVYSGGLAYEYSEEGTNYGLVKIQNGKVEEAGDFKDLQTALDGVKDFSGDGGYNPDKITSECPQRNAPDWDVEIEALPATPEKAKAYMKDGAGKGPGFGGDGSQGSGTPSSGTATSGPSGAASSTASPTGAAVGLHHTEGHHMLLMTTAVLLVATFFGAALV